MEPMGDLTTVWLGEKGAAPLWLAMLGRPRQGLPSLSHGLLYLVQMPTKRQLANSREAHAADKAQAVSIQLSDSPSEHSSVNSSHFQLDFPVSSIPIASASESEKIVIPCGTSNSLPEAEHLRVVKVRDLGCACRQTCEDEVGAQAQDKSYPPKVCGA
ncbi:hypothetical protein B0H14DRAFT_2597953 [Mycena olivaceomarginata]|nr:hypothetical protein B0H14DRAFT_2648430 [Mycena olivaceomarginata]KAJ7823300.1 hypothetical protein B0H14DRAFT_2597953 [Mycena olivaceomarginata]